MFVLQGVSVGEFILLNRLSVSYDWTLIMVSLLETGISTFADSSPVNWFRVGEFWTL
jgi:hypothetical protein